MRAFLTLAAFAAAASVIAADDKKDEPKMKKHELKVEFATPNPSWKATISEARVVGKELWVKVDVASAGGIAIQVIGKAKAEATVEAPDLPVKYGVFGKTWNWKDDDAPKNVVFVDELSKEDKEKLEKEWKGGKVVYEAKKKDEKKDK